MLEFTLNTNPTLSDTDGDGLNDGEEANMYLTDPILTDTDGDTLSDGDEINLLETDPLKIDSDGDWIDDGFEVFHLVHLDHPLDPNDPTDGLLDADEDTLPNQLEFVFASESFDLFAGNDPATFPWLLDPDGDGLSTLAELTGPPRTNPIVNLDTDGDGLPDDWERQHNLDPTEDTGVDGTDGDPEPDGLTNFQEWLCGTDPHAADSDNDGRNDSQEISDNTNPLKQDQPYVPPTGEDTPIAQFEDVVFWTKPHIDNPQP